MDNKTSKKISSTIIKLIVIGLSIVVFSYAWFVNNETGEVSGIEVGTVRTNNIQVSATGEAGWGTNLSIFEGQDFQFDHEITSNGFTFYKLGSMDNNGNPLSFVEASRDDYIMFDVWFKNDVSVGMFLEDISAVSPASGTTSNELIYDANNLEMELTDITRLSAYGEFSRDLIAGAVRVAVVPYIYDSVSGTYTLDDHTKIVWAPNKGYYIYEDSDGNYQATLNSNTSQDYRYYDVTNTTTFALADVPNLRDTLHASYTTRSANGDPMLLYIDTETGVEAMAGLSVRIWVEGNDRDAVQALKGGIFNFNLTFLGIQKTLNENIPQVSITLNTISGMDETMEYSTDNKVTWTAYDSENIPTFTSNQVVYVRYLETTSTFASDTVMLDFGV